MPHGIIVKNGAQEVVLDSSLDLLVDVGGGTSTGSPYLGSSAFVHDVPVVAGEFIAWKMTDGRWVAETIEFPSIDAGEVFDDNGFKNVNYRMISNAGSVPYRKLRYGSNAPATGGYGILLKDGNSRTIFHSDQTLVWMAAGKTLTLSEPNFGARTYDPPIAPVWCIASGAQSGFQIRFSTYQVVAQIIIGAMRRDAGRIYVEEIGVVFPHSTSGAAGFAQYRPAVDVSIGFGVLRYD
jgi:hypothetical protein